MDPPLLNESVAMERYSGLQSRPGFFDDVCDPDLLRLSSSELLADEMIGLASSYTSSFLSGVFGASHMPRQCSLQYGLEGSIQSTFKSRKCHLGASTCAPIMTSALETKWL